MLRSWRRAGWAGTQQVAGATGEKEVPGHLRSPPRGEEDLVPGPPPPHGRELPISFPMMTSPAWLGPPAPTPPLQQAGRHGSGREVAAELESSSGSDSGSTTS